MFGSQFYVYLFLLAFCASAVIAETPSEEGAVRNIIENYYAAWNKHDSKKIAEFFAVDGDLRTPWNERANNRNDIEKLYAAQHSNVMKNASIKATIDSIRLIKPEIAFVDVESTILGMGNEGSRQYAPLHHHVVYLLVKKEGKWEILIGRPF